MEFTRHVKGSRDWRDLLYEAGLEADRECTAA